MTRAKASSSSDLTMRTALLDRHPKLIALTAGFASATGFAPLELWPVTLICVALLMALVAVKPGATLRKRAISQLKSSARA